VKRALLVGINRYPTAPLRGCLNDVEDWHKLLTSVGKYHADNIRTVCDERATTQGIRDRMEWLKAGLTGPGDEVFFAYSGHGSQVRDRGVKDELADNMDEILCPVDLDWNTRIITDDDIGDWLAGFPKGVKITVVLDCCHSGDGTRELRPPQENLHYETARFMLPPLDILLRAEGLPKLKGVEIVTHIGVGHGKRGDWRKIKANGNKKSWCWWRNQRPKPAPKPVVNPSIPTMNHILIAGCRSNQTSAEAIINGRYNGALSRYLIDTVRAMPNKPIQDIYALTKQLVTNAGYSQEPQAEGPDFLLRMPFFT